MQRIKFKMFLIILIAVLLGIAIHFTNPVTAILLLIIWIAATIFSIAAILIGLFSKKFRLWYLIGFLPFLVGYGFETGVRNYKHNAAMKLNIQLERYKIEYGKYPKNLINLNSKIELRGLVYSTNKDFTNYRIEYLMDQFNREYYHSESNSWGTLGWND